MGIVHELKLSNKISYGTLGLQMVDSVMYEYYPKIKRLYLLVNSIVVQQYEGRRAKQMFDRLVGEDVSGEVLLRIASDVRPLALASSILPSRIRVMMTAAASK